MCLAIAFVGIWLARNGRSHVVLLLVPLGVFGIFLLHGLGVVPTPRGEEALGLAILGIFLGGTLTLLCIFGSLACYLVTNSRYSVAVLGVNLLTFTFFLWWITIAR